MSCYKSIIMYTHIFGPSTVQMIAVKANSGKEEVAHICVIFRGSHWTMLHHVQHPGPKRVQSLCLSHAHLHKRRRERAVITETATPMSCGTPINGCHGSPV
jgi:hypothetical protein